VTSRAENAITVEERCQLHWPTTRSRADDPDAPLFTRTGPNRLRVLVAALNGTSRPRAKGRLEVAVLCIWVDE
jgi:hypothetical protein